MDFDLEIDLPSLEQLTQQFTLTTPEKQQVTQQGAQILQLGIQDALLDSAKEHGGSRPHTVDGVTYTNRAQHFPGLENGVLLEQEDGDSSTAVAFNDKTAYYWNFVEDGHYVMDNRPDPKRVGRNYKYKLTTLDHGNRRFGGLHFLDKGTMAVKDQARDAMKVAFINKINSRG